MISFEEAIQIHELLIQKFGGSVGLRDQEALKSALTRPYQTFEEQNLYPTPEEKAAAVLESIISNHPFLDGNKRLGFVLMKLILLEAGLAINASHEEIYNFIIQVATGEHNIDSITNWIKFHVNQNKP
ncbi:MAG: type II toxin-antitoxin system death-on-curing family toxin [Saprospiraceae bacterium]|nr:type II toxin-antitoxin system death-on-curing family toxin [Candidatus Opimibacter skivensis]